MLKLSIWESSTDVKNVIIKLIVNRVLTHMLK